MTVLEHTKNRVHCQVNLDQVSVERELLFCKQQAHSCVVVSHVLSMGGSAGKWIPIG